MAVPHPLKEAIRLVAERSAQKSKVGTFAAEMLPLLEAVATELMQTGLTRPSRRGTGEMKYFVEKTQQGEVLTEQRAGKTKPFRCPKSVYAALATVLAAADRPLLIDEIMSAMLQRSGDRPPDHQVRVALRLWMHAHPSLVIRNRARYRADQPSQFSRQASDFWIHLSVPTH